MLDENTLQQILNVVDENDLAYLVSTYMEQNELSKIEFKSTNKSGVYVGEFHMETAGFYKYDH